MKKSKYFKRILSQRAADGGKRYRKLEGMGFGGRVETEGVDETERILRYEIKHMIVCDERMQDNCIKPGGTAGDFYSCPSKGFVGVRVFLI